MCVQGQTHMITFWDWVKRNEGKFRFLLFVFILEGAGLMLGGNQIGAWASERIRTSDARIRSPTLFKARLRRLAHRLVGSPRRAKSPG
jgi:hypothetical protein